MQLKDVDINDSKALIAFGEDFFDQSAAAKRRYEQQWLLNLAFVAGDQLVHVNQHTGRLDRVNTEHTPTWIIHVVNNRLLSIYRNMGAKLTKSKPRPTATAVSSDERDIQAARAATKLEENHWKTLSLDTIHPELVNWMITTGNGFYKQFWNPKKGERVVDLANMDTAKGTIPGTGLPAMKLEAAIDAQAVDFTLGDTDLALRSPFNIYPQPGKTKLREMRLFGDAEVMDVGEIKERYGKDVEPEKESKFVRINQAVEGVIEARGIGGLGRSADIDDKSAVVKELYILSCEQFKDGLTLTWANNVLLSKEPKCEEIPITHIGLLEVPGRFWHKGIIDDLIPVQRRWNELISKIEMHNDYYNDPPIFYDPNRIDIEEWTTEPGLQIPDKMPQKGGPPVSVLQVPQLDGSIFRELEILDTMFEVIPAMHKVSFGKDSVTARSGVAINFLQEKDEDIIRPLIDNIEAGYAQVFRRDFKLCQEHYNEDRGFAIVGEDNEVEWIEFKRANLDAEIDVGVEAGSAMPRNIAAKQAMVMDMLTAGFFTDPRTGTPDFAKALKYLEFGSVSDIYEESSLDSNQAKRENQRLKELMDLLVSVVEGEGAQQATNVPQAEHWHNHAVHMYEHNRLRKTAEFEGFHPMLRQLFAEHIKQHEMLVAEAEQAAIMKHQQVAMMAQGKAPAPGSQAAAPQQIGESPADEAEMTAAHVDGILQQLQQVDPQAYDYIMSLPEDQQIEAVMAAIQGNM